MVKLDLAVEARDLVRGTTGQEIPGVSEEKQDFPHGSITVIKILDERAESVMGKPKGTYITIEAPDLRLKAPEVQSSVADALAQHLRSLLKTSKTSTVLIIGLGNWQATPDALGPTVVKYSLITRHLHQLMPEVVEKYGSVCAFAPGVLGITGIETAEIIQGIVSKVKPEVIIAVDALAATSISRLGTTIQIGDTGISPGSGVNNDRVGVTQQTMGVPVIAIGVPTVVNAGVIIQSAIQSHQSKLSGGTGLNPATSREVVDDLLKPFEGSLIVTPRDIDDLILNAGRTLTRGITLALHPEADKGEIEALMC
jgi:spore protease